VLPVGVKLLFWASLPPPPTHSPPPPPTPTHGPRRQLAAGGRKLGQLAAAELAELFGGREDLVRARGRFMQLLYTAHRMGLLHAGRSWDAASLFRKRFVGIGLAVHAVFL
jgi:hypothetical protein